MDKVSEKKLEIIKSSDIADLNVPPAICEAFGQHCDNFTMLFK